MEVGIRSAVIHRADSRHPDSVHIQLSRPVHSSALHQVAPVTQYPNDVCLRHVATYCWLDARGRVSNFANVCPTRYNSILMSLQIFVTSILVVSKAVPRKLSFSDLRMIVDHLFIGVTNLNKRLKFFTTFENNWALPFFKIRQSNFFSAPKLLRLILNLERKMFTSCDTWKSKRWCFSETVANADIQFTNILIFYRIIIPKFTWN